MRKRILSVFMTLVMLLSLTPVMARAETSGQCGDNLTWTLDDNGTLTISGTGDMQNWGGYDGSPWYKNRDIKDIKIMNGVTSIEDYAFWECGSVTSITIPDSVTSIGNSAFRYCSSLTSITIPDSVTSIGDYVFDNCSRLTSITIPDSVTIIGNHAFDVCSRLASITIPDSVTIIGDGVFEYCRSLTSITIPDSVTSIGDFAFYYCSSVTSITIPDSVTSIGAYAFYYCSRLTSITIPNSVTSIGDDAFSHCSSLKDVYYSGTQQQWQAIMIGGYNDYLTNATIHYNSTSGTQPQKPVVTPAPQVNVNDNYAGGDALISKAGIDADHLLRNISVGTDKIKGPKISILGHDFYLFELDGKCSLSFGNVKIQLKADEKKNSIQLLGGYDFLSESTATGTSYSGRGEWTKAYNELKSLHNALNGGTPDDKTARSKFSSVYNKLNKTDSNLFLNIKGNFALYGELAWDNGSWKMIEGGGILKASASGSIDPRIGGIFYGTFGLSVDASGKFSVKYDTQDKALAVDTKLTIEPAINVGVGAGSKKAKFYIEGGLKGKLPIDIAAVTGSFKDGSGSITPLKVTAKGYIYMSGKAAIFGVDKEWQLGNDAVLYPRSGGEISLQSIADEYTLDKSDFKMLPRDYGNSVQAMSLSDEFDKFDLYPYSAPKIAALPDGRQLMLWIDDDASKADADRTSLYYSIYTPEDNTWSEAQLAVSNAGYNDLPQIYQSGDSVHIVWTCIDEVLGDTADMDEMMSKLDLYYTCFDGNAFSEPYMVSQRDNGYCEMLYSVSENNGTVTVAWAENSQNDLSLSEGTNSVYKRTLSNGGWSDIKTVAAETAELHDIGIVKNGGVVYELGENEKAAIYLEGQKIGESENDNAAFRILDNEVYYLSDSVLNTYSIEKAETKSEEIGEITDITIIDNGDEKIALFLLSTGFTNELYQNEYQNGKWGKWTQLTEYNRYIRDYSAVIDQGTLSIALNLITVKDEEKGGYGEAELKVISDCEYSDIILDDAPYYSGEVRENGNVDICFNITNNSRNPIDTIHAEITDENGNALYSGDITCNIEAGQTEMLKAAAAIPTGFKKQDITVTVSGAFEENHTENNTAALTMGFSDLSLEELALKKSGDKVMLEGFVKNIGFEDAENVVLKIYNSDSSDELLETIPFNSVASSAAAEFAFELPQQYLAYADLKQAVYLEVVTDSEELETGNNSDRLVFADLADIEEITEVTMSYADGMLTVKSPNALGADFTAAYYDEDGSLLACRKAELAIGAGTNNIPIEGLTTGANVKFMLWGDDMKPLCDCLTWE